MKKLLFALMVLVILLSVVVTPVLASPPDHAGTGGRPEHAKSEKDRNDPDDDGRGPDRGDGTRDNEDWNNGCGNDDDRDDDNEGWCGKPKPEKPEKPKVIKHLVIKTVTCKVVLRGETPELFPVGWEPSDGEDNLIAEANGELEYTLELGQGVTVFFWTPILGHSVYSHYEDIVCAGEDILVIERSYDVSILSGIE